jgi:hypothetical protein
MEHLKGLEFHDKIIKTGKGESKFAVRYNKGDYSPMSPLKVKWDYNAKSVSLVDKDCGGSPGIYAVEWNMVLFHRKNVIPNLYVEIMKSDFPDNVLILLESTEDDVLFRSREEIAFRQCNIVYVGNIRQFMNFTSIRNIIAHFLKEKETSEYNNYF